MREGLPQGHLTRKGLDLKSGLLRKPRLLSLLPHGIPALPPLQVHMDPAKNKVTASQKDEEKLESLQGRSCRVIKSLRVRLVEGSKEESNLIWRNTFQGLN